MTRKQPTSARKPNRTRTKPIQVYVTSDEHTMVSMIASARGMTLSELVRSWIQAGAAARGWHAGKDPRQIKMA